MQQNKYFAELSQGKFTIADVFEVSLSYLDNYDSDTETTEYSCNAVFFGIYSLLGYDTFSERRQCSANIHWNVHKMNQVIEEGLTQMGLDTESGTAFLDVENPQQARSIWLAWCQMMAEEQGV